MTLTEAMKVSDGTITSSPGPMPHACNTRKAPVVQLETPTACSAPHRSAKRRSNSANRGPPTTQPLRTTSAAAAASASPKQGRLKAMASLTLSSPGRQRHSFASVRGEAPIADVVFLKIGGIGMVGAEPIDIAAQPLVEVHLGNESERLARETLAFVAEVDLHQGLSRYIDWFRTNHPDPANLQEDDIRNWRLPAD